MGWWLLGLLALVCPAAATAAERVDVVFPTLHGQYILTVDPARLSEGQARELVVLSPHMSGWTSQAVVPRLELCLADDPAYLDCEARTPTVPAFFWNARANVAKGVQTIAALNALRHPSELDAVVDYLKRSLALSLWLEETRLAYYQSWDEQVLGRPYGGVEPARECRAALQAVAAARTKEDRHHRVEQDWHNCVNSAARRDLGAYPEPAWQAFLVAYGIRERLVEIGSDPVPVRR
ncbi:MAG: hypothetical protein WED01_09460 [Candidatus Rokuibacteriota bacterium]